MTAAYNFEAKNYAFRKSKDGVIVSFVVHPNDVTPELMALPVGARIMIAWSQIGDDEKPVASGDRRENSVVPPSPTELPQVHTKRERSLAEQCAICCADERFQIFLRAQRAPIAWSGLAKGNLRPEECAANIVRSICAIGSRAELGKGNHDADNRWRKLHQEYRNYIADLEYKEVAR